MPYKYSICHPGKEDIEYLNNPVSAEEVLNIARNYRWNEKLELCEVLDKDKVYCSPSLDFNCIEDNRSFCLTANYSSDHKLEFSLWYNRPKIVKSFFLEKEKMLVDDIWAIDFDMAMKYLEYFVNKDYDEIEKIYDK